MKWEKRETCRVMQLVLAIDKSSCVAELLFYFPDLAELGLFFVFSCLEAAFTLGGKAMVIFCG